MSIPCTHILWFLATSRRISCLIPTLKDLTLHSKSFFGRKIRDFKSRLNIVEVYLISQYGVVANCNQFHPQNNSVLRKEVDTKEKKKLKVLSVRFGYKLFLTLNYIFGYNSPSNEVLIQRNVCIEFCLVSHSLLIMFRPFYEFFHIKYFHLLFPLIRCNRL